MHTSAHVRTCERATDVNAENAEMHTGHVLLVEEVEVGDGGERDAGLVRLRGQRRPLARSAGGGRRGRAGWAQGRLLEAHAALVLRVRRKRRAEPLVREQSDGRVAHVALDQVRELVVRLRVGRRVFRAQEFRCDAELTRQQIIPEHNPRLN